MLTKQIPFQRGGTLTLLGVFAFALSCFLDPLSVAVAIPQTTLGAQTAEMAQTQQTASLKQKPKFSKSAKSRKSTKKRDYSVQSKNLNPTNFIAPSPIRPVAPQTTTKVTQVKPAKAVKVATTLKTGKITKTGNPVKTSKVAKASKVEKTATTPKVAKTATTSVSAATVSESPTTDSTSTLTSTLSNNTNTANTTNAINSSTNTVNSTTAGQGITQAVNSNLASQQATAVPDYDTQEAQHSGVPNTASLIPQIPNHNKMENYTKLRLQFLKAEAALAKGQMNVYHQLKSQLKGYPLYPYLLYTEYDRNIQTLSIQDFQAFMEAYFDMPMAEQLRNRWLSTKANQADWQGFLKAYVPTKDLGLQCNFLWAELQTRADKKPILEQVVPLWLTGKDAPKACVSMFQQFETSPLLTRTIVWQKIKLAIQGNNIRLAKDMKRFLKKNEHALIDLWVMVHHNPYLVTHKNYFSNNHPAILEILEHGISQIAKDKPEIAITLWQQIGHKYPFTERHWGMVVREVGLALAKQRHKDAEKWLAQVPDVYASQAVHEWRMRLSLGKEDWQSVLHWSKRLPEPLMSNETWQYWQARALEKINRKTESQNILAKLAETRSYYGFLASQRLGKAYPISHQKFSLSTAELLMIAKKQSVLRAKELLSLGRESKARQEWLYSTQRMTDGERHAAAALALRWNLPNWSILALSKANNKNDLALRFPIVHSQPIIKEAKRHQIDPAMIFALTRQESAFVSNARSSSGALGLMQLMPGTAQLVAKKQHRSINVSRSLFEPQTNIQLGTHYFKMMLEAHDNHPILAAAAYNAGPGRIKKWLPNNAMSADAWIETIPFKETREYVKNVMTYTIIYQQLLGHKMHHPKLISQVPAGKT